MRAILRKLLYSKLTDAEVEAKYKEWNRAGPRGTDGHLYLQYAVDGPTEKKHVLCSVDKEHQEFLKSINLKLIAGMKTPAHFREVAMIHNGETGECREVPTADGNREYGNMVEEDTPGTADVAIGGYRTLEVWDYKFGARPISAKGNYQLLHNALCFNRIYVPSASTVVLGIQQVAEDGSIENDVHVTDTATLAIFEKKLTEAQERAKRVKLAVLNGDTPEVWPDKKKGYDYCLFCKARPSCPAYKGK
jgi:hypothetical protein